MPNLSLEFFQKMEYHSKETLFQSNRNTVENGKLCTPYLSMKTMDFNPYKKERIKNSGSFTLL